MDHIKRISGPGGTVPPGPFGNDFSRGIGIQLATMPPSSNTSDSKTDRKNAPDSTDSSDSNKHPTRKVDREEPSLTDHPSRSIAASLQKNNGGSRGGSGEAYATPPRSRVRTRRKDESKRNCPQVTQNEKSGPGGTVPPGPEEKRCTNGERRAG